MNLAIAETRTGTWNYHLREVKDNHYFLSGGSNLVALCGKPIGWDTKMPLESWGKKSHIPSSYCKECEDEAKKIGKL